MDSARPKSTSPEKIVNTTLSCVDLFCGCGGMSLGFQNAGFDIVAAFDNWKAAVRVYQENFEHPALVADVSSADISESVKQLLPDIIIGGPPCQDFSSAGPNNLGSSRANLVGRFVDIIEASSPRYFVMENVPRLRIRDVFQKTCARLRALGYGLTIQILDASLCGVPQTRKRLFVVGAMGEVNGFLDSYLRSNLSTTRLTMKEYFGERLNTKYYFRVPTNYNRRGVFSVEEPSMTIRAVDRPIPNGYPGHPEDPAPIGPDVRALTVLERSYIQTFPETFVFSGSKTDLNQLIGNAVPVKLAEFVANALLNYIRDEAKQ